MEQNTINENDGLYNRKKSKFIQKELFYLLSWTRKCYSPKGCCMIYCSLNIMKLQLALEKDKYLTSHSDLIQMVLNEME